MQTYGADVLASQPAAQFHPLQLSLRPQDECTFTCILCSAQGVDHGIGGNTNAVVHLPKDQTSI